jgi:CubicO group peptidase (beta-lactamase class C family)
MLELGGAGTMAEWLDAALDYIPSWLEFQLRVLALPGCAIAIAHGGKIVLDRAFGYADTVRREPLTPRHRFRAASHAKSFTAAGILKLRETAKLRLHDPIGKYVPAIDRGIAQLKIFEVLCHGGGIIRDGADCGYFFDRRPYPTASDLMADFQSPPLVKRDKYFKYSNQGYGLLGLVIEAVTGEAYASWIKREIMEPAGLNETSPDMPIAAGIPFARGHTDKVLLGERVVVPGDYSTGALAPASGLVATASDLAVFFSQLSPRAATSVLSRSSRHDMTRKRLRNRHSSVELSYGFGTISGAVEDWRWFGHTGGLQGYLSRTKMLPAQDLTISVLANSADAPAEQWINGAIHILRTFKQQRAPSDELKDWTGRWWGLWGAVDLVPMGDVVMVANPQTATPFLDASQLRVSGHDTARIAASTSFLYFGETARRMRNEADQPVELWLGGDKLLSEADRAAEIKKEARRQNGSGQRQAD